MGITIDLKEIRLIDLMVGNDFVSSLEEARFLIRRFDVRINETVVQNENTHVREGIPQILQIKDDGALPLTSEHFNI